MIQTYEKVNKLHLLKSHANECIAFFFYTNGFSMGIYITCLSHFAIQELYVHLLHIAKQTSAEKTLEKL